MKHKLILALALCLLLAAALPALAQLSANHDLSWHVIAGGGGESASASHTLMGTIGQPLVGQIGNLSYTLRSGFWHSGAAQHRIYLPLVVRNH